MNASENSGFETFAKWAQPKMSEFEREVFQEFKTNIKSILTEDMDRPFPDDLSRAMEFAEEVMKPRFQLKVSELLKEWSNETLDQFNSLIITREELYKRLQFYKVAIRSTEQFLS